MRMDVSTQDETDWLFAQAQIKERPFTSATPVIGPLLAWFRAMWNSVATKWYVRPILAQQNAYNHQVALRLKLQDGRLVAQDEEQTAQARNIAELTAQVVRLNQRVAELEDQLAAQHQSNP